MEFTEAIGISSSLAVVLQDIPQELTALPR